MVFFCQNEKIFKYSVSDIIQLLPEHIANQIAAGEVVQRPASAVKELLENALDAGATQIRLIVKDAGKTLVQVIDDGVGMSETDARMSFERHATSKIRNAEDLFNLRTMGFRGEALASIAAVAQVEMRTRKREHELGISIQIEASQIISQQPVQTAVGTSIAVKNLFYNIPARRNFLKSNQIEMQHINQEFERVALANPQVFFSLHHNGEQVFHLPKGNLRQRIVGLLGNKINNGLIPIAETTDALTINGFVCKPEFAKKTRGEQFFFVNNRFIKSSYLHHAVVSAYEDLLPQGLFPLYVIFLEIDPQRIDVNVHPTKQEIKFDDERLIYNYLRVTARHALAQHNITPSLDFDEDQALRAQYSEAFLAVQQPIALAQLDTQALRQENNNNQDEEEQNRASFFSFRQQNEAAKTAQNASSSSSSPSSYRSDSQSAPNAQDWRILYENVNNSPLLQKNKINNNSSSDDGTKIESRLVSFSEESEQNNNGEQKQPYQLHQRYIISPIRSGFMLIDQRAAHERILYEFYLNRFNQENSDNQQKIFPTTIQLSVNQSHTLREMLPLLLRFGIDLRADTAQTFLLHGSPPLLADTDEQRLIESLLEQYSNNMPELEIKPYEKIAYTLAQRSAVGVKRLEISEMQQLIDQLFACQTPHQNPSGQKTFIIVDKDEISRRFG